MSPPLKARIQVLIAALLFSTGGPAIKASTLTPWQIACFRSTVAALVLLALVPAARRALGKKSFAVGIAFGATMVLYVMANRATTAANAIFLQDTAPLYVMMLAPWLLAERTRWRDLVVMTGIAAGLVLILFAGEPASASAPDPARGNLYGAGAGLAWALTILGLRWLGRGDGSGDAGGDGEGAAAAAAGNLLAAAVALPFAVPVVAWAGRDIAIVCYLGAAQIALAYVFLNAGLRRVRAFEASLLLLLEPIASAALGAFFFGERPGVLSIAGAGLILLATAAKTVLDLPRRAPARPLVEETHASHRASS